MFYWNKIKKAGYFIAPATVLMMSCGVGGGGENLDAVLARAAGKLAADNDLKRVEFADLDGDGKREVILVYGPRNLLNFDVFYNGDGDGWQVTPMSNDKGNPREFVGSSLDSIVDADNDGVPEIKVSSMLYDGNRMVKEIHWSRQGYEVLSQETITPEEQAKASQQPISKSSSATSSAPVSSPEIKAPTSAPEPPPETKKIIPPLKPSLAVYYIRKGDTLYGLADLFGTSLAELEKFNNNQLQRRGLRVGQKIYIPLGNYGKNVVIKISVNNYKVQRGDNLSSIAAKFDEPLNAVKSWNPDLPADGTIKVGQTIKIHQATAQVK